MSSRLGVLRWGWFIVIGAACSRKRMCGICQSGVRFWPLVKRTTAQLCVFTVWMRVLSAVLLTCTVCVEARYYRNASWVNAVMQQLDSTCAASHCLGSRFDRLALRLMYSVSNCSAAGVNARMVIDSIGLPYYTRQGIYMYITSRRPVGVQLYCTRNNDIWFDQSTSSWQCVRENTELVYSKCSGCTYVHVYQVLIINHI